jgi:hypothetical protein
MINAPSRVLIEAKRRFGAHVCLRPDSDVRADIPGPPLRADSVEKVLAAVETTFLRAADAFNAVRHGGPRRLEQKLSATFFLA